MSCYLRYLTEVLQEAGVELKSKADRRAVDEAIHDLVGIEYKDCPKTWKAVKQLKTDEGFRSRLVSKVREAME